jgi:hypothetical protein
MGKSSHMSGSQKPLYGYPWDWVECESERNRMEEITTNIHRSMFLIEFHPLLE